MPPQTPNSLHKKFTRRLILNQPYSARKRLFTTGAKQIRKSTTFHRISCSERPTEKTHSDEAWWKIIFYSTLKKMVHELQRTKNYHLCCCRCWINRHRDLCLVQKNTFVYFSSNPQKLLVFHSDCWYMFVITPSNTAKVLFYTLQF